MQDETRSPSSRGPPTPIKAASFNQWRPNSFTQVQTMTAVSYDRHGTPMVHDSVGVPGCHSHNASGTSLIPLYWPAGVPQGHAWPADGPQGQAWPADVPQGQAWPAGVPQGQAWPAGVPQGHDWPAGVFQGHDWPADAPHGHAWHPGGLQGHAWPAGNLQGHVWPAGALQGHVWPAGALQGHAWHPRGLQGHAWPAGSPQGHTWPAGSPQSHVWPAGSPEGHARPVGSPQSHVWPAGGPQGHAWPHQPGMPLALPPSVPSSVTASLSINVQGINPLPDSTSASPEKDLTLREFRAAGRELAIMPASPSTTPQHHPTPPAACVHRRGKSTEGERSTSAASGSRRRPKCVFCSTNGEEDVWHVFKDERGNVVCPVLSAYKCRLCGATGHLAHTLKYCPKNKITKGDPVAAGLPPGLMPSHIKIEDIL